MTRVEPGDCCYEAWKRLDLWDDDIPPDEVTCPTCGNVGVIIPFYTEPVLPGVPEGAIKVDGFRVEWYCPSQEVIQ